MNDLKREKFEKWIKARWCKPNLEMFRDSYVNKTVQEQWESWQAAIESVVVELPPEHESAYGYDARELVYAIKNAGIKYE